MFEAMVTRVKAKLRALQVPRKKSLELRVRQKTRTLKMRMMKMTLSQKH